MKSILTNFKVKLVNLADIFKEWIRLKWGNPYYRYSTLAFLFFVLLGSSLPVLFRKPLALRVINSIDIDIIEQVNFSSVDFSLFRSFPFLNVRFSNFTTLGSKALGNSELLSVKYIDIAVDIWSVIDNSRPIYIRSIRFYEPKLTLLISSSGQKNYEVPLTIFQLKSTNVADNLMVSRITPVWYNINTLSEFLEFNFTNIETEQPFIPAGECIIMLCVLFR